MGGDPRALQGLMEIERIRYSQESPPPAVECDAAQ